jgi:branched-chain amino acid transport system ATP-binding protein
MLHVKDLSVSYGHITALENININIVEGQIVTLIGANGAGKSTFVLSVCNTVPKAGGQVIFMGKDITNEPTHRIIHSGICLVPEGRHIFPGVSVGENLQLGSMAKPNQSKHDVAQKVADCFDIFPKLKDRRKQLGGTLSGGEQQMLALARALMGRPKLLMLDEPSLGLAPLIVDEIFDVIIRIRKDGTTILLIEQNASASLQIADNAYVLENGHVVLEGSGQKLLENEDVKRIYLGI